MLNQEQFKEDLKAAYVEARDSNAGEDKALDQFVERMAEIIIKHIKTLEIEYLTGLYAPNGAVSGKINHNIK